MRTTVDREMRRLAAKHAARDRADVEMAKRFMLMARGLMPRAATRIGPGKRSCVVEMRRLAEKCQANIARYDAGRYDWWYLRQKPKDA